MIKIVSRARDPFFLALGLLFLAAGIGSLVTILVGAKEVLRITLPPAIGLVSFLPACFLMFWASKSTLIFTRSDIDGMLWGGRKLMFDEISDWRFRKNILILWLVDRKQLPWMRGWLRLRPGVPLSAVSAVVERDKVDVVASLLSSTVGPQRA